MLAIATSNAQYTVAHQDGENSNAFNNYSELSNGKSFNDQIKVRLQYYGASLNVNHWKLTARLTQDFISQNNSAYVVGAHYASLKYNSQETGGQNVPPIAFPTQAFQLSKYNEVTLINSTTPINPQLNRVFSFNLVIQGGNHLLTIPNGYYNSAYEFKLYKISGGTEELIGMVTGSPWGSARFRIQYSSNDGQSLSLQNGANLFNLQFDTAADFANGKSVIVNNGLRVNAYQSYQLTVKTSGSEMTSATTSATIPVSKLMVDVTKTPTPGGVQFYGPKALSSTDQVIARRTGTSGGNTIDYNLRFYIPPNALQSNIPAGTYTTYVYFVIVPN